MKKSEEQKLIAIARFISKWIIIGLTTWLFNYLLGNLPFAFILAYINSNIVDLRIDLKEKSPK